MITNRLNSKVIQSKGNNNCENFKRSKNAKHWSLKNSMCSQNLGIEESLLVPFSFDPFQCSADITIVVGVLSVCAATPIFFRVAATVKSSEKSGEGRRRAIYDEGTNVESGEKREILNGRERIPNATGEGKGRSNRSEKFGRRERGERRVIKREGTASLCPFSFCLCRNVPALHRRRFWQR